PCRLSAKRACVPHERTGKRPGRRPRERMHPSRLIPAKRRHDSEEDDRTLPGAHLDARTRVRATAPGAALANECPRAGSSRRRGDTTVKRTIEHFPVRIWILARATTLVLLLLSVAGAPARSDEATAIDIPAAVRNRPLAFEANRGQTDPQVRFLARGAAYTVFLTPTEAGLDLGSHGSERTVVRLKPVGTSATHQLVAGDPLPGVVNYERIPATEPIRVPTYASRGYAECC